MIKTPFIHISIAFAFLANMLGPVLLVQAQEFRLPAPGVMVGLSPDFNPPILKGIKVHPDNPFRFDFILDVGDGSKPSQEGRVMNPPLREETTRLIKYFLASLTIPEKDLWVNLSPYEKDRIIPRSFGQTEMGRDLLVEDYMLKQITASLIYPEDEMGKKFWKRIYEQAVKRYGTTNITVNTFNKVWIVPEKAVVYENAKAGTAYVIESKLKVMLEQDYLSLQKHAFARNDVASVGANIVREIVIPELTKEVNEDKNFSQLRQVYNSLILATWYKKKIKDSILERVYSDKNKISGVGYKNSTTLNIEAIYQRYLKAFKKGVFNYIKEEPDLMTQATIPRKYFSGGFDLAMTGSNYGLKVFDVMQDDAMMTRRSLGENLRNLLIVGAGVSVFGLGPVANAAPNPAIPKSNIPKAIGKWENDTNKAWDEVLKNILKSDGPINRKAALEKMGFTTTRQFSDILGAGYERSVNFTENNNFTFHDYVKAVMTFGYVESGYKINARNPRADGDFDIGIFGIHDRVLIPYLEARLKRHIKQDQIEFVRNYYLIHPVQYVADALRVMDSFLGGSFDALNKVRSVYGDYLFDYFGIKDEAEKKFLVFRTRWHAGQNVAPQIVARVLSAMYIPPYRGSFLVKAAAKAQNAYSGGILDITTPDQKADGNGDDQMKAMRKELAVEKEQANDRFLKYFEDFYGQVKAGKIDPHQSWESFKARMDSIKSKVSEQDFSFVNAPKAKPGDYIRLISPAMVSLSDIPEYDDSQLSGSLSRWQPKDGWQDDQAMDRASVATHNDVTFNFRELMDKKYTVYNKRFLFMFRSAKTPLDGNYYMLDVFDLQNNSRMSIARLHFTVSKSQSRIAKLSTIRGVGFKRENDILRRVLEAHGFRTQNWDRYWSSMPHEGFYVDQPYRNNGKEGIWNLDSVLMTVALHIARSKGAILFLINAIAEKGKYYEDKFGAQENPNGAPYDRVIYLKRYQDNPYVRTINGGDGQPSLLRVQQGPSATHASLKSGAQSAPSRAMKAIGPKFVDGNVFFKEASDPEKRTILDSIIRMNDHGILDDNLPQELLEPEHYETSFMFVVDKHNRVLGFTRVWLPLRLEHLSYLAVDKNYRSLGLGTLLLKHLFAKYHKEGVPNIGFTSASGSSDDFYKRIFKTYFEHHPDALFLENWTKYRIKINIEELYRLQPEFANLESTDTAMSVTKVNSSQLALNRAMRAIENLSLTFDDAGAGVRGTFRLTKDGHSVVKEVGLRPLQGTKMPYLGSGQKIEFQRLAGGEHIQRIIFVKPDEKLYPFEVYTTEDNGVGALYAIVNQRKKEVSIEQIDTDLNFQDQGYASLALSLLRERILKDGYGDYLIKAIFFKNNPQAEFSRRAIEKVFGSPVAQESEHGINKVTFSLKDSNSAQSAEQPRLRDRAMVEGEVSVGEFKRIVMQIANKLYGRAVRQYGYMFKGIPPEQNNMCEFYSHWLRIELEERNRLSKVYEYQGPEISHHDFLVDEFQHSDGIQRTWIIDMAWQQLLPENIRKEAKQRGLPTVMIVEYSQLQKFLKRNGVPRNKWKFWLDASITLSGETLVQKMSKNVNAKIAGSSQAMIGIQKNGGIDLTPANMNLRTQNSNGEIKFHLDPAMLKQLQNAPGFVPVIISVEPLGNLRRFLGIVNQVE